MLMTRCGAGLLGSAIHRLLLRLVGPSLSVSLSPPLGNGLPTLGAQAVWKKQAAEGSGRRDGSEREQNPGHTCMHEWWKQIPVGIWPDLRADDERGWGARVGCALSLASPRMDCRSSEGPRASSDCTAYGLLPHVPLGGM